MKKRKPLRNSKRRSAGRNRVKSLARMGATAVEFAIVANVLFMIVLTCMEFARMNMVRNLAQDAAYYGARQAIVPGATADEARAEANRIMGSLLNNGYSVTVSNLNSNSASVSVTVNVDMGQVALFAPYFLPTTNVATTVRMRTERYEGFYQQ